MSDIIKGLAALVVVGFLVSRMFTPDHAHHAGLLSVSPNAGYAWENPNSYFSRALVWNPGARDDAHPHIYADTDEGKWLADAGYSFTGADTLDVYWRPGSAHPTAAHVVASDKEGQWAPDDGYVFTHPDDATNVDVAWSPGKPSTAFSHISAYSEEGRWVADAGYRFSDPTKKSEAVWTPGNTDILHATAGQQEGIWIADNGYHIVQQDGKTYAVQDETYAPSTSSIQSSSSNSQSPSLLGWAEHKSLSTLAGKCADHKDGESWWDWAVAEGCSAVRDDQQEKANHSWDGH